MKAWRINKVGNPSRALVLEEVAEPAPGPGQALVSVEATGVNFADILLCEGTYQDRPEVPFTPGVETMGVVEAVGDGAQVAVGDRVAAMAALPSGGFAEKALIRASGAVVMPEDIPSADATALYVTYQTAHVALHRRAAIQPGEWLLVHAAAGGVGSAAVQVGLAAGATVIATAGGRAKAEYCQQLGAHHAIDYREQDVYEEVKAITGGRGVDVAYDPVGGKVGEQTRRLMAWEGRLVVIGFASGDIPQYPANHLLVKNYTVLGLHWGAYADRGGRDVVLAAHDDLVSLYRSGQVAPQVARLAPLSEVPSALADLADRKTRGRIAIVIDLPGD